MLLNKNNKLIYKYDAETLMIEPWGANSLRVRCTKNPEFLNENWALIEQPYKDVKVVIDEEKGTIYNGLIKAVITNAGFLTIYNSNGEKLLEEYSRNRRDLFAKTCSALEVEAREFKPITSGDYKLTVRFESLDTKEKIFGMGQYQQPNLDLKGTDIELAQRNSQASVPFAVSSLGYGLLWNNPAIGRAVFGKNIMSFEAVATKQLDYWVTAGNSPSEIVEQYADVTGKVPMIPDFALGFWQSKLRYQTQEELLSVAREYKRRNLPISVIVCDYFHWFKQGEWSFDKTYWPDPKAMVKELNDMGIELLISVWPTVDRESAYFDELLEKGYLVRTERGVRAGLSFEGETIPIDVTNPSARKFIWEKCKESYYNIGIKTFWLDVAEPEYTIYDFDNFRYYQGTNTQVGNIFPRDYAQAFYDGQEKEGQENIVNLLRCAWAGSQKYGALVWSGDIASSFESMRNQLSAGLNMGIAGIPWWTTDIGGFHGGDPNDPEFRELYIRWFQFGTFCPVMRLHGDREPKQPQVGTTGGATCLSGAENEVWSFGEEAYEISKKYLELREKIKPYVKEAMEEAHNKGTPVMRPLFYDFNYDNTAWDVTDQYMFGKNVLVAPILELGQTEREVYLPSGSNWKNYWTKEIFKGGNMVTVSAPIEEIPIFLKAEFNF